jgi:hypothetical protein
LNTEKISSNYFSINLNFIYLLGSFAQMEMTKYQLQAANKWNFDFSTESPISNEHQYQWETTRLHDVPVFYHQHIVNPVKLQTNVEHKFNTVFLQCENICPLSNHYNSSSSNNSKIYKTSSNCRGQTKITGEQYFLTLF